MSELTEVSKNKIMELPMKGTRENIIHPTKDPEALLNYL